VTGAGGPAGELRDQLTVRALLRLYPRAWRDRYADEFASVLGDFLACASRTARIRLLINAAIGAADAHIRLPGGPAMTDRIRRSLGTATCALIAFVIAGTGFQKMTEDQVFQIAARQHAAIGTSFDILRAAAIAAGVVVLASAAPLLWTVARQIVTDRRRDLLRFLLLPPAAIAAWIAPAWILAVTYRYPLVHSPANIAVATTLVLLGVGAAGCCAWSVMQILRRAELPDRLLRAQAIPMVVLVACMAVVTLTDLSWGLAVRAGDGPLFDSSSNGLLATSLRPSWLIGVAILAAATVVAGRAAGQTVRQVRPQARG
jgi:hypothetical protein